jgi:hypothetical protein
MCESSYEVEWTTLERIGFLVLFQSQLLSCSMNKTNNAQKMNTILYVCCILQNHIIEACILLLFKETISDRSRKVCFTISIYLLQWLLFLKFISFTKRNKSTKCGIMKEHCYVNFLWNSYLTSLNLIVASIVLLRSFLTVFFFPG